MKEKIMMLREKMRWWNMEVLGQIDIKVNEVLRELNKLDLLMGNNNQAVIDELVAKIKITSNYVWKNLKYKENLIRQKSRQE